MENGKETGLPKIKTKTDTTEIGLPKVKSTNVSNATVEPKEPVQPTIQTIEEPKEQITPIQTIIEEPKEQITPVQTIIEEPKEEISSTPTEESPKEETLKEVVERNTVQAKPRRKRHIFKTLFTIVIWVAVLVWLGIVFTDYFHIHNGENPQFCWFNKQTHSYNDGVVNECTGLGYKIIKYDRISFKAIEFGPFWIKDRTAEGVPQK